MDKSVEEVFKFLELRLPEGPGSYSAKVIKDLVLQAYTRGYNMGLEDGYAIAEERFKTQAEKEY